MDKAPNSTDLSIEAIRWRVKNGYGGEYRNQPYYDVEALLSIFDAAAINRKLLPTPLRHELKFVPAFHRCHHDPSMDYGIGGIKMVFAVIDDELKRGVSWELLTNMGLPDKEFREAVPDCEHPAHQRGHPYQLGPTPGPVFFHSSKQLFEHGPVPAQECEYIRVPCYSDVGFSLGDRFYKVLATQGDEVWSELERTLEDYFNDFEEVDDGEGSGSDA